MTLDYTTKGEVKVDIRKYVKKIIDEFPVNIEKYQAVTSLETDNLFKVDVSKTPNKNKLELFHTTVARGLFLFKRARPDIHSTISFLCTILKQPNKGYWKKLLILIKYLV